ncbi:hypothetical protein CPB84DRAFT_1956729 [Gymnopilus junonius]|uniref:Uncharacterized protein n=1 Tax=Gymnopilus junonius TaxID=109634 RepID=A0A9P5P4F7_GYMJU|nr:hypothetical protein CPB84DRAFT_1956729 [Gymnopilus junonius]
MAHFSQRYLKMLVLLLSCAQLGVEASPTPHTAKPLKGTPYLITILILVSLLLLLFAAKCMFVSHRRRRREIYQDMKPFGSSHFVWRDNLSMSSVNPHDDPAPSNNEKDAKSAFLVGLLGSPSWETRPFAKVNITFDAFHFNGSFAPSVLKQQSKQRSYRLSTHAKSHWYPLERSSGRSKVLSKCKDLMTVLFMPSRGNDTSRSDETPEVSSLEQSSPLPAMHSDLSPSSHQLFQETNGPISTPEAPSGTVTLPPPALILPCTCTPSVVSKASGKDYGSLLSHHYNLSLNSSVSHLAMLPELDTLPQVLSEEGNLYFRATPHSHSATSTIIQTPSICTSISSLKDRARLSPVLRPSPLRSMYLPSKDDDPVQCFKNLHRRTDDAVEVDVVHLLTDVPSGTFVDHRHDVVSIISDEQPTPNLRDRISSTRKGQPDNLVTFLEELVQATSAWDDSLFLDNNFKAMIDNSKPVGSSPPEVRLKKCRPTRKRYMSPAILEDIPEVDVTDFEIPLPEKYPMLRLDSEGKIFFQ